jgi:hypothetical protein
MYDIQYPDAQEVTVVEYDIFPYWDQLRVGDKVPSHIHLRKVLTKQRLDQIVRELFEKRDQDGEPGGLADILRACLGATVLKGTGRLSSDFGLRWKRLQLSKIHSLSITNRTPT